MNKNQLYDIETEMYRKIDTIKAEQQQYCAGFEKGIDMTVSAIKNDNGKYDYSIATDGNNVFRICKIRFCPMCGRLIDTEEEKNV